MAKTFQNPFSISESEHGLYDDIKRGGDLGDHWGALQADLLRVYEPPVKQKRIGVVWYSLIILVLIIWGRFGYLQLMQGALFASRARNVSVKTLTLPSERGRMYDQHGALVVDNAPLFSAVITPALFFPHQTLATLTTMANILHEDPEKIQQDIEKLPRFFSAPLPLRERLSFTDAVQIALHESHIPGLSLYVGATRVYPVPLQSLAHVVGYVGKITSPELAGIPAKEGYMSTDFIGKTGIEYQFESELRGVPERDTLQVNAQGQHVRKHIATEAKRGHDLFLTLDLAVQQHLEEALMQEMRGHNVHKAAAVAMDPRDGSVRALVSIPGVQPQQLVGGNVDAFRALLNDPHEPLFPRAIAGVYPSGSIIKPLFALAALQEGVIRATDTILSTGGIRVGQWFFPDWKAEGHGRVNLADALAWSVNTYFYTLGGGNSGHAGLGLTRLQKYLEKFKMGEPTGINLPGEAAGFFPTPERVAERSTHWYIGDTYNLSIGQGDLGVTPLQMAAMTAAFANGGILYQPRLVDHIVDTQGKLERTFAPVVRARDLGNPEHIAAVRKGLRAAVERGSAQKLKAIPGGVAGKTGTAQWRKDKSPHAWFTGFYPYNNPSLAIVILVEEGGEGSGIATQVAKDFFEWYSSNIKN